MTLELNITLPPSESDEALKIILSAGAAMRPTHVSNDEDSERLPIVDAEDHVGLLGTAGSFFWARECSYDIGISPKGLTIFAISGNAAETHELLLALSELQLEFAYACTHEERKHRNRVARRMSYGTHEAWVGRDITRYLPGIYWLTVVPVWLQQKLGVSVETLRATALDMHLIANRNWLIKLYERPEDWEAQADRIDGWCDRTPGVFSKKPAIEALAKATTFMEASDSLREWR